MSDLHGQFPAASVRVIGKLNAPTPMLVPSLSSRGFPLLSEIVSVLKPDLRRRCLFSAFDLAGSLAQLDIADVSNFVIVDSGGFETTAVAAVADVELPEPTSANWSRSQYHAFLQAHNKALALTDSLVVNHDVYGSVEDQIASATADFEHAPGAASDFLLKPRARGRGHVVEFPRRWGPEFEQIQVLGVTQKELGNSILDRCKRLLGLRRSLSAANIEKPIHVFGAITPAEVTAYFLCGADIFDGLNWLRVSFGPGQRLALSEHAVLSERHDVSDETAWLDMWQRNIRELARLEASLKALAQGGDVLQFQLAHPDLIRALVVAAAAEKSLRLDGGH